MGSDLHTQEIDVEETEAVEPLENQPETDTTEPQGTVESGTGAIETNAHDSDSDIEIIEVLPKKLKNQQQQALMK